MAQNMKMLRQLQEMQRKMARIQEELGDKEVEGTAGGGVVKVRANGHQKLLSVEISPEAVDLSDVGMLQDLVLAAANDALDRSRELAAGELGQLTAGLGLPRAWSRARARGPSVDFLPRPLSDLIEELQRLPGIGPKSAQRMAFHFLQAPAGSPERLAGALARLREGVRFCDTCSFIAETATCPICADPAATVPCSAWWSSPPT